ncbi:hypothetical protein RRG08_023025 [Elysia crispata]|uniref:Tyr recombinase domain-containing protein n=1 Tax=Elysia crispata TaxID=231223 RepID=A0AAE1CNH9_9GAST|nr:hypothetical protein RRG08_023025 [Elysia crispata]
MQNCRVYEKSGLRTWRIGAILHVPYKGVSRDTIRRWTKQFLRLSGVDTVRFKAHSTRAAATSLADFRHVPMDTILKFAGWKSSSTFARYYKRPLMADSESRFCHAVLTSTR